MYQLKKSWINYLSATKWKGMGIINLRKIYKSFTIKDF
jgi:hypothetical protein